MTKIEQVIEALKAAADILPQVNQHSVAHECNKALTTLRSLTEQGDGPYWIEETTVDMLPAWGIHGPTDVDVEWFRNKKKAQDYCDELNAAVRYGRLSAELQQLYRDEYVKKVEEAYSELIMAVERKFEGETRHETALRYINERERSAIASASDAAPSLS